MKTTPKPLSRLAWMKRVRDLRSKMELFLTLANDAIAYADENYSELPQSAAVRLDTAMREIAGNLPEIIIVQTAKVYARCKHK